MDASQVQIPKFPIVGIGASAGGIEALEAFFRPMPAQSGMAFVIITHLSPAAPSVLHEIIARFTDMPVHVAANGMAVRPNEIFVMSETAIIGIKDGLLEVHPQTKPRERRPVDIFFVELALDQGDYACGIILSGGDGDGATGISAIKERGGLTLAQGSEGTAPRHPGMPDSAIATGLVDFVAQVEDMAAILMRHVRSFELFSSEEADAFRGRKLDAQKEIYAILRTHIGHDFSGYKPKTFNRRVHRRMQVLQLDSLDAYVERLRQDPGESSFLFRDLLINVTSFFRDPDAFDALETLVIPALFEGRGAEDTVRVWIPGCATGEEVFSLAILMREHMDTLRGVPRVQLFATDIDESSLAIARGARFREALMDGISAERRRRFFTQDGGNFVLTKEIRDLCVFSPHSVIRDPPFSRMDLVSCRNLLIYFGSEVQGEVIPTFHYALRPQGYLFLGTSENISQFGDLFTAIDKKNRIFRARHDGRAHPNIPFAIRDLHATLRTETARVKTITGSRLRNTVESFVMDRFAPPHVVVNAEGEIVYYSPRTGKYLEAAAGVPSRQLLATARKGLRLDLRAALREAVDTSRPVTRTSVAIDSEDDRIQMVAVTVDKMPSRNGDEPLFIVVFADNGPSLSREEALTRRHGSHEDGSREEAAMQMERDLRESRERLQSMLEEYETALEELKSSNEELVSVNEELQSTNEELEASKEELQSLNEELHTVNAELTIKVDALDRSNTDLNNLFESTQIATVFLDHALAIRNFTPPLSRLFNILSSDRGRLLSDFATRLIYPDLHQDIRDTLASGDAMEKRVDVIDGDERFLSRLRAYRDSNGTIQGVICTFFDVTSLARSEESQARLSDELASRHRVHASDYLPSETSEITVKARDR